MHKPIDDCCCVNSNRKIRIFDYIKNNRLNEDFFNRDKLNGIYSLLIDTPPEFKYIVGFLMFNFDLIFISQGLDPNLARPRHFDPLIRKIISSITNARN